MRKIVTGLLAAAAMTALASGAARAADQTLVNGADWSEFAYGSPPDNFPEFQTLDFSDDLTFDFTLTTGSTLFVADGFFDGDQYSLTLTNVGTSVQTFYTTSDPGLTADNYIDDNFGLAFLPGSTYSHIAIAVGPGSYTLTGAAIQSPYGSGVGGVKLGGFVPVPEPTTWAMMLVGFGGLGAMLRRARRTSAVPA